MASGSYKKVWGDGLMSPSYKAPGIVDFNTLLETGTYQWGSNNEMSQCANRPCDTVGKMIVYTFNGNRGFFQNWTYGGALFFSLNGRVYFRIIQTNDSSTPSFGVWRELTNV